jgi:hypothetical protein
LGQAKTGRKRIEDDEMPDELRKISFDLSEVYAALEIYGIRAKQVVPEGPILKMSSGFAGQVYLELGEEGLETSFYVPEEDLVSALMVYCQQKRIPVPKGAKKVLRLEEKKGIVLIKLA